MPYAMACLGSELLSECFARHTPTLGEAMLRAKRAMMQPDTKNANRAALDALAAALSPAGNTLEEERAEHLDLFTLIGDPLLQLQQPQVAQVRVAPNEPNSGTLSVVVQSPVAGKCTLELVTRRDRLRFSPPQRANFQMTSESLAEYTQTYRAANDDRWSSVESEIVENQITTLSLNIPAEAHGSAHLRAFVQGQSACAAGSVEVDLAERSTKPCAR